MYFMVSPSPWVVLNSLIADIIDGRGLQIFLLHEDVSLQYYIPAVAR